MNMKLTHRLDGEKGNIMNAYYVNYKMDEFGDEKGIDLLAKNKVDAYERAVYELIPQKEGEQPYSAWVASVTYQNGNCHRFNTFEGKRF